VAARAAARGAAAETTFAAMRANPAGLAGEVCRRERVPCDMRFTASGFMPGGGMSAVPCAPASCRSNR